MDLTTKTVGGERRERKTKLKIMIVKMKDESEVITFNGRAADITKENLTLERFEWVKKHHPALLSRFEVIEEKKEEAKDKK